MFSGPNYSRHQCISLILANGYVPIASVQEDTESAEVVERFSLLDSLENQLTMYYLLRTISVHWKKLSVVILTMLSAAWNFRQLLRFIDLYSS